MPIQAHHLQPNPKPLLIPWSPVSLLRVMGYWWGVRPNHIEKLNPATSMGFHPGKIGENKNENGVVWGFISAHYNSMS